jgi:hypothetical protein
MKNQDFQRKVAKGNESRKVSSEPLQLIYLCALVLTFASLR